MARLLLALIASLLLNSTAKAAEPNPELAKIAVAIAADAQLVSESKECAIKFVRQRAVATRTKSSACSNDMTKCWERCDGSNGEACYWLANALQERGAKLETSQPLFQRSCKLGIMSGCTNHAAGITNENKDDAAAQRCAATTFEKVCAFDDPWACTMYALALLRGTGIPKDLDMALKATDKACRYDETDPACSAAKNIREAILKVKEAAAKQTQKQVAPHPPIVPIK